jgi:hypothetical protein
VLRPAVSAISLFGLVTDDRSEDRDGTDASAIEVATIVGWAALPPRQGPSRDAHPIRVRSFFVLHNAPPHCNMVGRICAEHPIERP